MASSIVRAFIEEVESRRHFSVVTVTGTSGDDYITTHISGSYLQITVNGVTTNYSGVTGLSVSGGGGNDNIDTSACSRNTTMSGGAGDDTLNTGDGNDQITGGDGFDFIFAYAGNDTVNGNGGYDEINGGDGADYLYGGTGGDDIHEGGDNVGDQYVDHLFANDSSGTNDGITDTFDYGVGPAAVDIVVLDGTPSTPH